MVKRSLCIMLSVIALCLFVAPRNTFGAEKPHAIFVSGDTRVCLFGDKLEIDINYASDLRVTAVDSDFDGVIDKITSTAKDSCIHTTYEDSVVYVSGMKYAHDSAMPEIIGFTVTDESEDLYSYRENVQRIYNDYRANPEKYRLISDED